MVSRAKSSSLRVIPALMELGLTCIGGASGIGKAMVEYFHSKGAKVVFGDLNDKNGKAIADSLGTYVRL
jgi:NADP-dependent 3-hydroxy acid dehydrogenase YdfG